MRAAARPGIRGRVSVTAPPVVASTANGGNVPSGTAAGDLLVALLTRSASSIAPSPSAGWTPILTKNTGQGSIYAAYRIADGTEGSSIGWITGYGCTAVMLRITGAAASSPIDGSTVTSGQVGASWAAPANVTATKAGLALQFSGIYDNGISVTAVAGFTVAANNGGGSWGSIGVATKPVAAAGAVTGGAVTISGSDSGASALIVVKGA